MAISISPENMKRFAEERARKKEKSGIRNFGEGFAQGAINNLTAIPSAINYGLTKGVNMLLPESIQMQPAPFPYKANFSDQNSNAAQWGELAGNIVSPMPGIGVLAKAPGAAMKVAGLLPGLGAKVAGGALQGGAAYAGAHATENPNEEMTLGGASIPVALGGALAGAFGFPAWRTNNYAKNLKQRHEANPNEIRSPQEVGEIAQKFPENSIDLASLANDKGTAKFYTNVLGNLPLTGVRNAEQKSMKAGQEIKKDNSSTWERFKNNAEESDVMVGYEKLFDGLDKKYGAYKKVSSPYEKYIQDMNVKPAEKENLIRRLKEMNAFPDGLSAEKKQNLIKEARVPILKGIHPEGDRLIDALQKYQELGTMVRSTKSGTEKARLKESQNFVKDSIDDALNKSGRQDLLQEWKAANKSHVDMLKSDKSLKGYRVQQGKSFGGKLFEKTVGSPTGKTIQLGALGALGLISPGGGASLAAANMGAAATAKAMRSKSLRDAYVTGGQVSEKGLSKEIFPIWMRALGVPTKNSYKGEAQSSERNKRKRNEPLELTLVGGRKREDK